MSNELIDIQAQIAKELGELDRTIAPPSGHRISLKGKQFGLPDGNTTSGALDAVIIGWRSVNMYYTGAFNPQKPEDPACYAIAQKIEDLVPSPNCKEKQAEACKDCAWNQWGSAPGGGRGKACKNTIRLAVVPADATRSTPVWTIDLAPTSTTAFNNYVNNLKAQLGVLPMQVITKLDFDQTADFPKLTFTEPTPHDNLEVMFHLRDAADPLLEKEPGS